MFGIGASSSRSSGQSSSYDFNQSSSFSDSLAQSLSRSGGTSFGSQSVWNADILERVYGGALKAAEGADAELFKGEAAELYSSGAGFLDRLGVGAGEDYLSSRLTDTSSRDAQLDVLQTRMGSLFSEELNPAITARHVAGGSLGGGRQGVAQAQAVGRVQREFAAGATDIISRDQAAKDAAAVQLIAGQNAKAGTGLNALPGMLGLAQAGLGAEMAPYAALASIVGGPTVLTESGSQDWSEATSEQVARAISNAMGWGTSQSSQSSKSKSFNFGV